MQIDEIFVKEISARQQDQNILEAKTQFSSYFIIAVIICIQILMIDLQLIELLVIVLICNA